MNQKTIYLFLMVVGWLAASVGGQPVTVKWRDCLRQKPDWYGSVEAIRVAENLILFQRETGGWPKNTEMADVLSPANKARLIGQKRQPDATIDNNATTTQMIFLARVFNATKQERFKTGFLKGLDYLLKAQYANGGWPQFFPLLKGYYSHITYNDDAMVKVLGLLRDVTRRHSAYVFVDADLRQRAEQAVAKGIECILKTQVVVAGKRTVWCAQHDEVTLKPANARSFEKISLSGLESVGIVRFLMEIESPDARVIEAIDSAVAWFQQTKLTGIKVVEKAAPSLPTGKDRVIVADAGAAPLWARFYEIGTNRPIFCGRDGVIKFSLAEIEHERRNGYSWYSDRAANLLEKEYPSWRARQIRK